MKKYRIWCVLLLLMALLCACGKESTAEPQPNAFAIAVKEQIPQGVVGEAYKLSSVVTEEKGIEYTYTAGYTDPATGETVELKVKNKKITPKAEADITVTVTATKGEETSRVTFVIPVPSKADIMDQLLASNGEADVTKTITKDTKYLRAEGSISALEITFTNPSQEDEGAVIADLSHYALQAYYSAQVWRNAAVSFWVYSPMEQDVSFKLGSVNPYNQTTLLWDSPENTQVCIAKAGQWTQVVFSLYDMGITKPLVRAMTYENEDSLTLLARYEGSDSCTLYIDGLDIVHAESIEGLTTGYKEIAAPAGNFSDLLKTCKVYTRETDAKLTESTNGNGSKDAWCFNPERQIGYPMLHVDFSQATDIRGFDYLKFDVFAENAHPWVSVAIRYLDENGQEQKTGTSYDFYREQWKTIFVNLSYLPDADLSQVVGFDLAVYTDKGYVDGKPISMYFDNMELYEYPGDEPQMMPAMLEDNDIISGVFYTENTKPNTSGVCKVAVDETGEQISNSTLLFWANNACGYPNVTATFPYEQPKDWSDYDLLSLDAHQYHGHYLMIMDILYLDENGKQKTLSWRHDTVFTHWQTVNAPLEWFQTEDGESAKPEHLKRVVGFRISVDLAANVTAEVAHIYFDNMVLS